MLWLCAGAVALPLLGWFVVSTFRGQQLVADTYRRARQASASLRAGEPLSDEELVQHVPAHLRVPGETVTWLSETWRRPTFHRAAVLSELTETREVLTEGGGFEGSHQVSGVSFRVMGWFEGGRLELKECTRDWPAGTAFVVMKEDGSARFTLLHNAGQFTAPAPKA